MVEDPTEDGPVVIVTGASKGLGLSITRILLSQFNARVVAVSRTETPELATLEQEYEDRLILVSGDVSDPSTPTQALLAALQTFSHLTALILNAGTLSPLSPIASSSTPEWRQAFDINLFSLVTMLQVATPSLREGGRVVCVSSGASTGAYGGWGCYSAAKAAMNSLVRTYASEEPTISTYAVRPGVIDMQAQIRETGKESMLPSDYTKFSGLHAAGKLLHPDQPGYVIAALAVRGPKELSGGYLNWEGEELKDFQAPV